MVSLIEELEAREAAVRVRVEALESQIAELMVRLEAERETWSRLRVTREMVAEVVAAMSAVDVAEAVGERASSGAAGDPTVRVVGAIMVPHWREGLSVDALPDVYRDIVEVVADTSEPMQAKQIVPRIGLPAVTAKIEGTRGKLKRLVERGWLDEDAPGQFSLARQGPGRDRVNS